MCQFYTGKRNFNYVNYKALSKVAADDILQLILLFFRENTTAIHMKCQAWFSLQSSVVVISALRIEINANSPLSYTEPGYTLANSLDPDQLASKKPTDLDLHCLPINMWIYIKYLDKVIWLAENLKRACHFNLFSRTRANELLILVPQTNTCTNVFWVFYNTKRQRYIFSWKTVQLRTTAIKYCLKSRSLFSYTGFQVPSTEKVGIK